MSINMHIETTRHASLSYLTDTSSLMVSMVAIPPRISSDPTREIGDNLSPTQSKLSASSSPTSPRSLQASQTDADTTTLERAGRPRPLSLSPTAFVASDRPSANSARSRPLSTGVDWFAMEDVSSSNGKSVARSLPPTTPTGRFSPRAPTPASPSTRQPTPSISTDPPPSPVSVKTPKKAKSSRFQQRLIPSMYRSRSYAPSVAPSANYAPSLAESTTYYRAFRDPEYKKYPRNHAEDMFSYEYQRGKPSAWSKWCC